MKADHQQLVCRAAAECNSAEVQRLIRLGADPNTMDAAGHGPLLLLASEGLASCDEASCVETLQILLAHGATVDARDHAGNTPLILASLLGRQQVVEALLSAGADPNIRNGLQENGCAGGYAVLHYAVVNGSVAIIEALLGHGADVNLKRARETLQLRPLDLAVRPLPIPNRAKVIALLERAGARRSYA